MARATNRRRSNSPLPARHAADGPAPESVPRARLPSVDRLLRSPALANTVSTHGRRLATDACREVLDEERERQLAAGSDPADDQHLASQIGRRLQDWTRPSPRRVFNLTGTVLHTNLGRAVLPPEALEAIAEAAGSCDLEYDLDTGRRGKRDTHAEQWLRRLTGAEAAVVVNNNAAAVLLVLNTLAHRKEAILSRGELIEIGGSFRMPDIMARAGCRLREVGTTNKTHDHDYETAIGPKTALLMKVHASNFEIRGFTSSVGEKALAEIAHRHDLPLFVDLGSGSLVDLEPFGLPHERTPREALADGVDLVSFSGDKLLGGPQAGIIVGRCELIARIRRNPLLRALRLDKLRLAALGAILRIHGDPDRLQLRLTALRALSRSPADLRSCAEALATALAGRLEGTAQVEIVACESQVGSGALPTHGLPSVGVRVWIGTGKMASGEALQRLARRFRQLPVPMIGRMEKGGLLFDVRGLEDGAVPEIQRQIADWHWPDIMV